MKPLLIRFNVFSSYYDFAATERWVMFCVKPSPWECLDAAGGGRKNYLSSFSSSPETQQPKPHPSTACLVPSPKTCWRRCTPWMQGKQGGSRLNVFTQSQHSHVSTCWCHTKDSSTPHHTEKVNNTLYESCAEEVVTILRNLLLYE